MSRASIPLIALLGACSIGLEPYVLPDDTAVDVDGPDDTALGDTADTADTDTAANEAPLADAGDDLVAMVGDIVNLDGSGSLDPDGDALTWAWVMTVRPAESAANLLNADQPLPRFYADAEGTFTLTLTVSDGLLESTDEVDVIVEAPNEPPVADAGPDQFVTQGDEVQLDGSGSFDPDGDTIAFQWQVTSRPSGSTAPLVDATGPFPRFEADAAGEYVVELVVADAEFDSAPDQVRVTAEATTTGDGGDCGASCAAAVRQQVRGRLSLGDAASGPGLALLAVALLVGRRRRA